jgi:hypothetical protein
MLGMPIKTRGVKGGENNFFFFTKSKENAA